MGLIFSCKIPTLSIFTAKKKIAFSQKSSECLTNIEYDWFRSFSNAIVKPFLTKIKKMYL